MWSNTEKCGIMWSNAEKCRKMWSNAEKCGSMQLNVEQCREIWSNPEKCGVMQRKAKKYWEIWSNAEKCGVMRRNAKKCRVMPSDLHKAKHSKNPHGLMHQMSTLFLANPHSLGYYAHRNMKALIGCLIFGLYANDVWIINEIRSQFSVMKAKLTAFVPLSALSLSTYG